MPKRPFLPDPVPESLPARDLDLCKAVFSAAVSQILYARRAFPPESFQLVPLSDLLVAPFEDIGTRGSSVQSHDKELLRDQGSTLFLRQGADYGVNRFLGILRNDILPLIDHEGLVKFRINFLRDRTWNEKALVEYYTVALKYQHDGGYELDVWRAGTGRQHVATTESQLWNLGDYLSRLPGWTEPMHWTLAFHATERPDDPPIGVWRFDRTDFDDANLDLQQRRGYSYARIARLQIEPLPPADADEAISESSLDIASETSLLEGFRTKISSPVLHKELRPKVSSPVPRGKGQRRAGKKPKGVQKNRGKTSGPRGREPAPTQLSPPPTLVSGRNTSKSTVDNKQVSKIPESLDEAGTRKALAPKRKVKRPLQLFETAASSLPPTQIIDESQSLSHKPQLEGNQQPTMNHPASALPAARSSSPDPMKLLDGISLSPGPSSPNIGLPPLPVSFPNTQLERRQATPAAEFRGILRLGPSSSVYGGMPGMGMSQWERASPPIGFMGIEVSDGLEAEGDGEGQVGGKLMIEGGGEVEEAMSFDFEGDVGESGGEGDGEEKGVKRRESLFYDSSCGSGGE